jgi:hypothetical protein
VAQGDFRGGNLHLLIAHEAVSFKGNVPLSEKLSAPRQLGLNELPNSPLHLIPATVRTAVTSPGPVLTWPLQHSHSHSRVSRYATE